MMMAFLDFEPKARSWVGAHGPTPVESVQTVPQPHPYKSGRLLDLCVPATLVFRDEDRSEPTG